MNGKVLRIVVVTPERKFMDTECQFVAIPAFDGEIGILPGRAPLVARLGPGTLRVQTIEGMFKFYVDGGFGQVQHNEVSILTPMVLRPHEIDLARLQQDLVEAYAMVPNSDHGFAEKQFRIDRVFAQRRLAGMVEHL